MSSISSFLPPVAAPYPMPKSTVEPGDNGQYFYMEIPLDDTPAPWYDGKTGALVPGSGPGSQEVVVVRYKSTGQNIPGMDLSYNFFPNQKGSKPTMEDVQDLVKRVSAIMKEHPESNASLTVMLEKGEGNTERQDMKSTILTQVDTRASQSMTSSVYKSEITLGKGSSSSQLSDATLKNYLSDMMDYLDNLTIGSKNALSAQQASILDILV